MKEGQPNFIKKYSLPLAYGGGLMVGEFVESQSDIASKGLILAIGTFGIFGVITAIDMYLERLNQTK